MKIREIKINEPFTASPIVFDVDNDGINEIILLGEKIHVIKPDSLKNLKGFPIKVSGPIASTPFVKNYKGNTFIYFGSDDDNFYILKIFPEIEEIKRIRTGGDIFTSPLVYDVDQDGKDEIIFGSDDFNIYILKDNKILKFETKGFVSSSPSIFFDNRKIYIVFCSWDKNLYVLYMENNKINLKFKKELNFLIWSSPFVCDINKDSKKEIIILTDRIFVFDINGNLLEEFHLEFKSFTISSPCICDINKDGNPEIIIASDALYVISNNGKILKGFPFKLKAPSLSSPLTCDFNGDSKEEIIIFDYEGNFYVVDKMGNLIIDKPLKLSKSFVSTPFICDVDKDGKNEIINVSFDGKIFIIKTEGNISSFNRFRGPNGFGYV